MLIYSRALVLSSPSPSSQGAPSPGNLSNSPFAVPPHSSKRFVCCQHPQPLSWLSISDVVRGRFRFPALHISGKEVCVEVQFQGILLPTLPLKCQIAQP